MSNTTKDNVPTVFTIGGCVFLILQNVFVLFLMKFLSSFGSKEYLNSTIVFMSETVKMLFSIPFVLLEAYQIEKDVLSKNTKESKSLATTPSVFDVLIRSYKIVIGQDLSGFSAMAVPAFVYAFQNNLIYYALENLPLSIHQVTYQMKILTTALFSVLMFKRTIPSLKVFALVLLTVGVIIVSLSSSKPSSLILSDEDYYSNITKGLIAISIASITSGFAGVFAEVLYKTANVSLWVRNTQLGIFSMIFTSICCFIVDSDKILEAGFFQGWSPIVCILPVLHALGGMMIGFIVKYTDNLVKGFATSMSMVVGAFLSAYIFDQPMTYHFVLGAALVIISTVLYSIPTTTTTTATTKTTTTTTATLVTKAELKKD